MRSKSLTFLNNWLPAIVLLLIFISEGVGKYYEFYYGTGFGFQKYLKAFLFVGFAGLLLKNAVDLIAPIGLMGLFLMGQIFLPGGMEAEVVISGFKFIFPILLLIYFARNRMTAEIRGNFFKTFEWVMILNAFLIVVGLIGSVFIFQSYAGPRWGYNGLFLNTAGSSYVYSIAFFYFLLRYKHQFLTSWKTWLIIISALFTGTKIIYISLLASVMAYIFFFLRISENKKKIIGLSAFLITAIGFYIIFFQIGFFGNLSRQQGLQSAIFSFRNDSLRELTLPFIKDSWSWINYLFGGINDLNTRSEFGFIDLFYYYGIIGGLVFLFVYKKTFIIFPINNLILFTLATIIFIILLAGNFFENGSIAAFVLLLREILLKYEEDKEVQIQNHEHMRSGIKNNASI